MTPTILETKVDVVDVLKQALEALEYADTYWQGQNAIDLWGPAINAIKDALAETAPKVGDGETATLSQPLQKIGARLAELLDEDQWAECEALLLAASHQETYTARPPTPTGWSDTDWIKHLQQQRDELLAALGDIARGDIYPMQIASTALAKVKQ